MGCGSSKDEDILETINPLTTEETERKYLEEEKIEEEIKSNNEKININNNNSTINKSFNDNNMLFIDNNLNNSNKKHKKLDSNLLIESIDERLSDSNFKRKVKPLKTNYGNIKKLNLSDLSISDFKNNKKNSKISKDFESLSAISDIKKKHVKFKSSKKKDSLKRDLNKESEMLYFENEKGEENDKKESEESIHSDIEEIKEKEIEYEDDNIEMGRVSLRTRKKNKKIILPKTQIKKVPKWVETKKLFFQKLIGKCVSKDKLFNDCLNEINCPIIKQYHCSNGEGVESKNECEINKYCQNDKGYIFSDGSCINLKNENCKNFTS